MLRRYRVWLEIPVIQVNAIRNVGFDYLRGLFNPSDSMIVIGNVSKTFSLGWADKE